MGTVIFIVSFLSTIYFVASVFYFLVRRKYKRMKLAGVQLFVVITTYITLLLIFSLSSKNTVLPFNKDKCFDDWCAAVTKVDKYASVNTKDYIVTLKITNQGRGHAQKPDSPHIYVLDDKNNIHNESVVAKSEYEKKFGKQRAINSLIQPQSSFETVMVFRLQKEVKGSIVITEGGFPTSLIITDEGSFFHKKSMTPLD